MHKGDKMFWKEVNKINNEKSAVADVVNHVSGSQDIANMWCKHFSGILNSSSDVSCKEKVLKQLNEKCGSYSRFTVSDVMTATKSLKCGKASGLDNISAEHLKYADDKLYILLSIVFNAMVIHNYIPEKMLDTVLVPLIKDKHGDLSDHENYRPLALTCVISKLFEFLVLHRYEKVLYTTANQFGFKSKLSTDMCIFSLKQIVDYYNMYNSPVYLCFLDASKAFDKLNHWHLFNKLLNRGLPCIIVRILLYLYVHQKYSVRWSNCYSESFYVSNGAPQGRILSPSFFNVYMDELSRNLQYSNIGCILNGVNVNHLFYADDAVLVTSSPCALQRLLDICTVYANKYELKFNVKKTKCMVIKPKKYKNLVVPNFILNSCTLEITDTIKYLGCIISSDRSDNLDIKRQIRSVYARGNVLISKFRLCSDDVKVKLFKAYCSSFYGFTIWSLYNRSFMRNLITAYKKIFRAFFSRKREGTTFQMLSLNIQPFSVLHRKCLFGFIERIEKSDNTIVSMIVNAVFYHNTEFFNHSAKILYSEFYLS